MKRLTLLVFFGLTALTFGQTPEQNCQRCQVILSTALWHFNNSLTNQADLQAQLIVECNNFGDQDAKSHCLQMVNTNMDAIYMDLRNGRQSVDTCTDIGECPPMQFDFTTCGTIKGCFLPVNTSKIAASYRRVGMELEIELFSNTTAMGNWVAIGFSRDDLMGNDYVTECSSINNGTLSGKLSWNMGRPEVPTPFNTRITDVSQTDMNSVLKTNIAQTVDGMMYCKLRQKIYPNITSTQIGNLNDTFWLLLATGTTNVTGLNAHNAKEVSQMSLNPTMMISTD